MCETQQHFLLESENHQDLLQIDRDSEGPVTQRWGYCIQQTESSISHAMIEITRKSVLTMPILRHANFDSALFEAQLW